VHLVVEFLLKPSKPFAGRRHRPDVCVADHWLGGRGTDDLTEPAPVGWAPGGPAGVAAVVSPETSLLALCGRLESSPGLVAGMASSADGVVLDRGDIDRREIARAPQAGPWDGVTTVGVDPIAGLLGDPGEGHDPADLAFLGKITVEPIPTRPRFLAKGRRVAFGRQCPDPLVEIARAWAEGAEGDDRGGVCGSDRGDRNGRVMDIHADVSRARLVQGCPPRWCLVRPEAALAWGTLTRGGLGGQPTPADVMMSRPHQLSG